MRSFKGCLQTFKEIKNYESIIKFIIFISKKCYYNISEINLKKINVTRGNIFHDPIKK